MILFCILICHPLTELGTSKMPEAAVNIPFSGCRDHVQIDLFLLSRTSDVRKSQKSGI